MSRRTGPPSEAEQGWAALLIILVLIVAVCAVGPTIAEWRTVAGY